MANEESSSRNERLSLDITTAQALAGANRRMGELGILARVWPLWPGFAAGPLTAVTALAEALGMGYEMEAEQLLALGPEPDPARPAKPLRWAVGITQAIRRLERQGEENPLTPSVVSETFYQIDAPHLSRSYLPPPGSDVEGPLPGSAVWTLAPRWVQAGLPPLWAAGLALATWEKDGPDHPHRLPAGRVLLMGLAPRLGLSPHAFIGLGAHLEAASESFPGGWPTLLAEVRGSGAWRRFVEIFLDAVEKSAAQAVDLAVKAMNLYEDHRELIDTWVRAPRHPQRLLRYLYYRPVLDLPQVAAGLDVTQRTAGLLAGKLAEQGLLIEVTGQRRGRRFAYAPLLELLQPGWTPPTSGREE